MNYKALILAFLMSVTSMGTANADENVVFEGDQRLACEALLCLAAGWGEPSCRPSIRRFLSIWSWRPSRLFSRRMAFLGMCPSEMNNHEQHLIVNYSGRCQGQRFTNYVSAYQSYTEVETENGGIMRAACRWHDKQGIWMHSQAKTACASTLNHAARLSLANQDCAAFKGTFGVQ